MIKFRLPRGVTRFEPSLLLEELREQATQLYEHGLEMDHGMPDWMRPPLVNEQVTLPGYSFQFTVREVIHCFGPDNPNDDTPFAPHTYVVLR
jgi:hypothetical protein